MSSPPRGSRRAFGAALAGALAALSVARAADAAPRATAYSLQTSADVELCIPAAPGAAKVLYRTAVGTWEPAQTEVAGGTIRVRVEVARIKNGRTLLVFNVPEGVNLSDNAPPALVRCTVDGQDVATGPTLDLGGVETPPKTVSLLVRDELSPLLVDSLAVWVNGRRLAAGAPGVSLAPLDPRQARIDLDLAALTAEPAPRTTVAVSIDDGALDDAALSWQLSFACAPVQKLPDGSILSVDSVTSAAGWEAWQVITDGQKMDASGGTTAGRTWLSAENDRPHWVSLRFPAPREITGVALWWAYYECYRTSSVYEVQTWDGTTWVTQVRVKDPPEGQCSRHSFPTVTTAGVRVWQPAGGGHPGRARYLWLSEVEVF